MVLWDFLDRKSFVVVLNLQDRLPVGCLFHTNKTEGVGILVSKCVFTLSCSSRLQLSSVLFNLLMSLSSTEQLQLNN